MTKEVYLFDSDYIGQVDSTNLYACSILDLDEKGIVLNEAIACKVTEELNGPYEFEMEYPVDSDLAGELQVGKILGVETYWHWGEQHTSSYELFRIYEINKSINEYKILVYASHISYDLCYYWVPPYNAPNLTRALTKINETEPNDPAVWLTAAPVAPWRFGRTGNESTVPFYNTTYRTVRSNLMGDENSILDVYGGEYIFNNYDTILAERRGADRGLVLRYGVNMSELEQTFNTDETYSHIFSYWTDYDVDPSSTTNPGYIRGSVMAITNSPTFTANTRIYGYDASSLFDSQPTVSQLDAISNLIKLGVSTSPAFTINLSMSQFQDMLVDVTPTTISDQTYIYQVSLGDTITIAYKDFINDLDSRTISARIVKVVYNVITHNFDELEIGKIKPNLDKTVAEVSEITITNKYNWEITVLKHTTALDGRTNSLQQQADDIESNLALNYLTANEIAADYATINELHTNYLTANEIAADYATIHELHTDYLTANDIAADYATINELHTNYIDAGTIAADYATINELHTDYIDANTIATDYLKADASNIGDLVAEKLYSDYGLVSNLVIQNGVIVSGDLEAVTIHGDLIDANTIKADKLVILGQDGLYYQLNTDGETVEASQTDYNSLDGSHIQAQSITANKITVTDLEAFGATIGAFEISGTYNQAGTSVTQGAIKSHGKTSATDNVEGVYLGVSGTGNNTVATFGIGAGNSNHITYNGTTIDIETDWVDFDSSTQILTIGNRLNGATFQVDTDPSYPTMSFYNGTTPLFSLGGNRTSSYMPLYVYGAQNTSTIQGDLVITGGSSSNIGKGITCDGEIYTSFGSSTTDNTRCVAIGSRMASASTIPNLLEELRYSSGCMGSVSIVTAYSLAGITIPTGWYNYIYTPHRQGGKNGDVRSSNTDNTNYGTLLLSGMTVSSGLFVIQYNNQSITSVRILDKSVTHQGTITGTNGTWRYRRWSDGFAEVWYMGSVTFSSAGSSYQGWYRSVQNVSIATSVRNITGDFNDTATVHVTGTYNAHIYTSGGIKSSGTAFEAQVLGMNALAANTATTNWSVYISGYPRAVG